MSTLISRPERKNLKTKYAQYAHIQKDKITIYCSKLDREGIKTEWRETCPNDIKIRLQSGKKFNASSLYINENLVEIIKDLEVVEYWPNNEGTRSTHRVKTIILRTKKLNLSFNDYEIEGKSYKHCDTCLITSNENLLFS